MRIFTPILSFCLLFFCSATHAYQPMPPIPPIPPMPRPPEFPPLPPFSTEEAQYQDLKEQYMQDLASARKKASDQISKQCINSATDAVRELDQLTEEYTKTDGSKIADFKARYVVAAQKARAAINELNQHLSAELINVSLRLEEMKDQHKQRFEKDRNALEKAYEPLRKILMPVNDAQSAIEPIEFMVEVRLSLRRMKGEVITPAIEEAEKLQAAAEILEAERRDASKSSKP